MKRGLGLCDLENLSSMLVTKTWWWWLHSQIEPWENIWRKNYMSNIEEQNLIYIEGHIKGSHIWNET